MNSNEMAEVIVRGVVASLEEFNKPAYASFHRNLSGLMKLERFLRAKEGWVRFEPAWWLGRSLSAGERKAFSRVLKQLEAEQTVVTLRDGRDRVAWVGLTELGVELAELYAVDA